MEIVGHIAEDILRHETYPFSLDAQDYDEDAFVRAIDDEDGVAATSLLRGALDAGMEFTKLERGFARAALAHYADFGHSLIYVTKAAKLIERLGHSVAWPVLAPLVRSLAYSRREEQIPEFRHYETALKAWPGSKVAVSPDAAAFQGLIAKQALMLAARHGAADPLALYQTLLTANANVSVRRPGDGVKRSTGWSRLAAELPLHLRRHHPTTEGLHANNMLAYDMDYQEHTDRSFRDNVGWLDFTHAITFANAVHLECAKFPKLWPQGLLQMACFSGRNAP